MKVIFFGTPEIAARVLQSIHHQLEIIAVVTQPDKPRGRSQKISYSPVKKFAAENLASTPLLQPKKASDPAFIHQIKELGAELLVVLGYGQILKKDLLDACKIIPINIHTSLLPQYRGAAPMQRALMNGDKKTGVTIMKMDEGMDTGNILAQKEMTIPNEMTLGELEQEMTQISGPLLLDVIKNKNFTGKKQDNHQATYAKKLDVKEFEIAWDFPAQKIHNQIRALSPKPGAWSYIHLKNEQKRVKILRSRVASKKAAVRELIEDSKRILVGCKENALEILELQLEGKAKVEASSFLNGFRGKFFF